MGADQIGFLVVGPDEISPKAVEKAAGILFRKQHDDTTCSYCGDSVEDGMCNGCGLHIPSFPSKEEALAYVQNLADQWPPDWRDCCVRSSPFGKNKLLVYAGDMSGGDEPSGGGYEYLKFLLASGISGALGIR